MIWVDPVTDIAIQDRLEMYDVNSLRMRENVNRSIYLMKGVRGMCPRCLRLGIFP
ncbi:MAG: hypothetical protein C5S33_00735 [ANME-2 cluster archaeon]|nr:hypothetical protein [ANME-2 cluster archaeon]